MNMLTNHRKQTGSTLIEVLIALLVLTIGLQGIASMQYQSIKDNFDSTQRSHGVFSAQELINRIRANPTGRENGRYNFNGDPCGLGARPVPFCADVNTAAAAVCGEAEMATFDIWESICPTPNQSHAQNNSQLINPNLIIQCVGGCSTTAEFDLTLQWQSKSVTDDNVANNTLQNEQFSQVFKP